MKPLQAHLAAFLPSVFLILLLLATKTLSSTISHLDDDDPKPLARWCAATPYPYACRRHLAAHTAVPRNHAAFFSLSLKAALKRTLRARSRLIKLKKLPQTHHEKHAWADCYKLYTNTVLQLNRTIHHSVPCTSCDPQSWLSAALTNLDMCSQGFGASPGASSSLISPLKKYNVSDLISNCLAINRPVADAAVFQSLSRMAAKGGKGHGTRGGVVPPPFPSWLTEEEMKLLEASAVVTTPTLIVAKDGRKGSYPTIGAAVAAAAQMKRTGRLVISVKAGVYDENVQIPSSLSDVTLVGAGRAKTIITGNKSVAAGYTLITSATLAVFADGFIARGLTFRNTYGTGSQALALFLASDRSVIYRCNIQGHQDTLCPFSQRQFYRECVVSGTVDFIFGNAAAVFQNCTFLASRPAHGEAVVITAQGRTDPNQNTGFVIQFSSVRADKDLIPVLGSVHTFLGRPWKPYSRTVFLQSYISSVVDPRGWLEWNKSNSSLDTLYYAEFRNVGTGAKLSKRVRWPGYHIIVKPSLVQEFTVDGFIAGSMWIPSTGTPLKPGL